jgi:Ca-activated chloride channel family protein
VYRLIGFDNKLKALADTLNDVEGGEVGSGHSMMALFEITPVNESISGQFYEKEGIAKVTVSYRLPNDSIQLSTSYRCPNTFTGFDDLPGSYRFASAVAMFGALLKESKYMQRIEWNDILQVARNSMNPNDEVQQEFLTMVSKAKKIYGKPKRKRKESE